MRRYLYAALLAGIAAALVAFGWREHHAGYESGVAAGNARVAALTAQYAQASAQAAADARARHGAAQAEIAAIDAAHQRELTHAKQDSDRVIADLRDGNLRLRREWAGCQAAASVPGSAGSTGVIDAATDRRANLAAAVVRAGAEADAQIRALQAILKADRQ